MKAQSKETLKKKAWKHFSEYIRKRDPWCVTHLVKGRQIPSQNAGHFWHGVLDFDEENVNGQCINCNKYNSGSLAEYSTYLLKKLGKEGFDALDQRHTRAIGGEYRTEQDYLDIIEKYKKLSTDLDVEKSCIVF